MGSMNFTEFQQRALGEWNGENLLRTPWMTPPEMLSDSVMRVVQAARDRFLALTYSWRTAESPHEGLLLLGYDDSDGVATAAWVDSWHQNAKVLSLEGNMIEGTIQLRATYQVNWQWRIVISMPSENSLEMLMYNVSPEGSEDLAVRATYLRNN